MVKTGFLLYIHLY